MRTEYITLGVMAISLFMIVGSTIMWGWMGLLATSIEMAATVVWMIGAGLLREKYGEKDDSD